MTTRVFQIRLGVMLLLLCSVSFADELRIIKCKNDQTINEYGIDDSSQTVRLIKQIKIKDQTVWEMNQILQTLHWSTDVVWAANVVSINGEAQTVLNVHGIDLRRSEVITADTTNSSDGFMFGQSVRTCTQE